MLENVLLAQELVSGYQMGNKSPRCMLKIDLRKAFDSISWDFLIKILKAIGLPSLYIKWITTCISSPMFSVAINGSLMGYFSRGKGVRQGDPLSPYLFVLVLEALSQLLDRAAAKRVFKYHPKCHKLGLTHLAFADDLLIFVHGSKASVLAIMSILQDFAMLTGLQINKSKCEIFSAGIPSQILADIVNTSGFKVGFLPIRYLGVPLITKRLSERDCEPLIDRITKRISSWYSQYLSYAGRMQLIKSVLSSMCNFWCTHFLLPQKVLKKVVQLCSAFFWKGTTGKATGARVKWEDVCKPKAEGGLGLKLVKEWNLACLIKSIWIILCKAGSLWVAWVEKYILKGCSFWDLQFSTQHSWSIKKLLQLRSIARNVLQQITGEPKIHMIWQLIRKQKPKVGWHRLVWYTHHVPKHAVIAWIAIQNKLPTKDRLKKWGICIVDERCLLCNLVEESRDHIFFSCSYSKEIWVRAMRLCGVHRSSRSWQEELHWGMRRLRGKSLLALICRLAWGATLYLVWKERNNRLFGGTEKSPSQILLEIAAIIKGKLQGLKQIARDPVNEELCHSWGLHNSIFSF